MLKLSRPPDETGAGGALDTILEAPATRITPPAGASSSPGRPRHPPPFGDAMLRVGHRGEGIDEADTIAGDRDAKTP